MSTQTNTWANFGPISSMVSFDTMVLIWGVKQVASSGQEEMIGRTTRLLDRLRANHTRILLSTPVVAEYVGAFPPDDQGEQFRVIRENFIVYPFDVRAAAIAAKLLYNEKLITELKEEYGCSRQVIKTDMMIIATSVAARCAELYSNDGKIRKAAQGEIRVKEIPETIEAVRPSQNAGQQTQQNLLEGLPENGE